MALIDEGKLQGNVIEILSLLRKQATCCGYISAQWMLDNSDNPVWVLVSPTGEVTVMDSPTGSVQASPDLPLKPPA